MCATHRRCHEGQLLSPEHTKKAHNQRATALCTAPKWQSSHRPNSWWPRFPGTFLGGPSRRDVSRRVAPARSSINQCPCMNEAHVHLTAPKAKSPSNSAGSAQMGPFQGDKVDLFTSTCRHAFHINDPPRTFTPILLPHPKNPKKRVNSAPHARCARATSARGGCSPLHPSNAHPCLPNACSTAPPRVRGRPQGTSQPAPHSCTRLGRPPGCWIRTYAVERACGGLQEGVQGGEAAPRCAPRCALEIHPPKSRGRCTGGKVLILVCPHASPHLRRVSRLPRSLHTELQTAQCPRLPPSRANHLLSMHTLAPHGRCARPCPTSGGCSPFHPPKALPQPSSARCAAPAAIRRSPGRGSGDAPAVAHGPAASPAGLTEPTRLQCTADGCRKGPRCVLPPPCGRDAVPRKFPPPSLHFARNRPDWPPGGAPQQRR